MTPTLTEAAKLARDLYREADTLCKIGPYTPALHSRRELAWARFSDALDAALAATEASIQAVGWISVADRLPDVSGIDDGEAVLVANRGGSFCAEWHGTGITGFSSHGYDDQFTQVTHWQPLPRAPFTQDSAGSEQTVQAPAEGAPERISFDPATMVAFDEGFNGRKMIVDLTNAAIREDTAMRESTITAKLVEMGWTPPSPEQAQAQRIRVEDLEEFDAEAIIGDDPVARAAYQSELARLAAEDSEHAKQDVQAGAQDEAGWLIEHKFKETPTSWIAVGSDFKSVIGEKALTQVHDASKALRFARKEDAEAVLRMHIGHAAPDWLSKCYSVTEHMWPAPPRTASAEPDPEVNVEARGLPPLPEPSMQRSEFPRFMFKSARDLWGADQMQAYARAALAAQADARREDGAMLAWLDKESQDMGRDSDVWACWPEGFGNLREAIRAAMNGADHAE